MKIAIDGRALTTPRTGGGCYTYHLLKELIKKNGRDQYVVCAHKKIVTDLAAENLDFRIDRFPLGILWQHAGLPRTLAREKADLLHSPIFTLPHSLPCPGIVTIFDLTALLFPQLHNMKVRFSLRFAMESSARRAKKIIAISENTRQDILKFLPVEENKIEVIYPGVSTSFCPSDSTDMEKIRQKYAGGTRYLLHVGTLEPRKNLGFLIDVYNELLKDNSFSKKLNLVLAGMRGWGYKNLFRKVEQLGIKDRVFFTEYVPESEMPFLYNAAEVFVFPSLYEGFGLPVLEAMASGIPVVTSSASSLPEVVGKAGMVINGWRKEDWTSTLSKMLTDNRIKKDFAERGIWQAKKFSWGKCAAETLRIYRETVR